MDSRLSLLRLTVNQALIMSSPAKVIEEVRMASSAVDIESPGKEEEDNELIGFRSYWTKAKAPVAEWTVCHTAHIVLLGCLLPAAICGGANYGVAYGIFAGEEPPTMWNFPIPIAGNLFAIILIQTFANYTISGCIQLLDVLNGIVPPLEPGVIPWWPKATSMYYWWLQPSEILLSPREEQGKHVLERFVDSVIRAGMWMLLAELLFWAPATLITWGIYGNTNYNDNPQPQWISALLGCVLALVFMPFWQLSCYVTLGQRHRDEMRAWMLSGNANAPLDEERPRSRLTMYRRFSSTSSGPPDLSGLMDVSGLMDEDDDESREDTLAAQTRLNTNRNKEIEFTESMAAMNADDIELVEEGNTDDVSVKSIEEGSLKSVTEDDD